MRTTSISPYATPFWQIAKYGLTLFLCIMIPVYIPYYGVENFLWLSDIGIFLTVIGLWSSSALPISMAMIGIFWLEFIWAVDFFVDMLTNINLIDLSDYMFDPTLPLWLRGISLFHLITPCLWVVYMVKVGYDKRAFKAMTLLYWCILFATFFFTTPKENINWVFLPQTLGWTSISPALWACILFFAFPLGIFLPMHLICKKLFRPI